MIGTTNATDLISFVTRDIELNAIFYGNRRLARKLLESGRRVDFVGLDGADPAATAQVPLGVEWRALGGPRVRQHAMKLAEYYRLRRPAVVLASGFNEGLACVAASWLVRRPPRIVVRVHIVASIHLSDQKSPFDRRFHRHVMALAFRPPVRILAASNDAARDFERLLGYPDGAVATLHDPVLDDVPKITTGWSHPWVEANNLTLVLAAGVLIPRKDFATLIRAFGLLQPRKPAIRLLIAGEGAQRDELQALIYELGLSDSVTLAGFVPNQDLPYGHADLFVCSSVYEGLGNVIIEALAAGCPVVSTDCPFGPAEILEDGRYGQLVPVGDPVAMAAAMDRALSAPVDREALKLRARDFHIDQIWPAFVDLVGIDAEPARPSSSSE